MITWDQVGSRFYETGIDRGVLYLNSGVAVPWNGITSVVENTKRTNTPVYFDGMKVGETVSVEDFSGTLRAITYPDEFSLVEGLVELRSGVFAAEQVGSTFSLSYRTKVGNDTEGLDLGYKVHVVFNLRATPSAKSFATMSSATNITEFEWTITATPEEYSWYKPTAHFIFDSTKTNPFLLSDIESILYGTEITEPSLPSLTEFIAFVEAWSLITITDNGDGTWTAYSPDASLITMTSPTEFQIDGNAVYLDADTYTINNTTGE